MFQQLATILKHNGDTVGFTLSRIKDSAELRVVILPKLHTKDEPLKRDRDNDADANLAKGLNAPIVLTGTPEELDGPGFLESIARFTHSVTTAVFDLASAEAEHKRVVEDKKKDTEKKIERYKSGGKPKVKLADAIKAAAAKRSHKKQPTGGTSSASPKPTPKPKPAAPKAEPKPVAALPEGGTSVPASQPVADNPLGI